MENPAVAEKELAGFKLLVEDCYKDNVLPIDFYYRPRLEMVNKNDNCRI